MTRTIAIANLKGGSCKTTTAVNLSACLAERGRRVLLVDLDPQASATYWYGMNADRSTAEARPESGDISDVLTGDAAVTDVVRHADVPGPGTVDVLPGSKRTAQAERHLAREPIGAETVLRRALDDVRDQYDIVIVDSPPTLSLLTLNGLFAASELVIPVEARILALTGLAELTDAVAKIRSRAGHDLRITGIVVCRVDSRARHPKDVLDAVRDAYGATVFDTVIRESIRLAEAPGHGQPITVYDPHGVGAADYRALTHELLARGTNGKA
jgi:chromosome partitioning protein